jgi:hypothetical protein
MPYHLSTIQDLIDFGYRVSAHCGRFPRCQHREELDLKALRKRLGPDYVLIANDAFTRALVCRACGHKGGDLRLSAAYMSTTQERNALEEGMRERYVALPDPDRPDMWYVYDQLKEAIYANEYGPVIEIDKHEARELAEILNNPDSFYAGASLNA